MTPSNVPILKGHYDNLLSGWNNQETILNPQNVNDAGFGKLFNYALDGYAYAQPLYLPDLNIAGGTHNVVFAATEHDTLYAFDADNPTAGPSGNGLYWTRSFIDPAHQITTVPAPADDNTSDVVPEVGITGTPLIDPATNTIYLDAKTKQVKGTDLHYVQTLYAIDVATGADKHAPVVIGDTIAVNPGNPNTATYTYVSGPSVPGTGAGSVNGILSFNALREFNRPALQLVHNADGSKTIYLAFASHGDNGPYHGWVLGYDAASLALTKVFNTSPNGSASGIWESGGNLGVDPQGNLYFSTGNGFGTGNDVISTANTALGANSAGLGYQGITHSLAVTFRAFDNGHSSTGLGQNGSFLTPNDLSGKIDFNAAAHAATPHTFQATLSYNSGMQVLTETLRDVTAGSMPVTYTYNNVNLAQLVGGNTAYVGFTGGTGILNAEQDLLSWTFTGGGTTSINHPSGLVGAGDLIANGAASLAAYPAAAGSVGAFPYHQDIGIPGNPSPAGAVAFNSSTGTYTLTASGTDLGFPLNSNDYDADRFQFAYNYMSGTTGSIVARVHDMTGSTNSNDPTYWTKALVQIRNSLDPQAQNVSVIMSPHNVSEMTWRDVFGGGTGAHERGTGTGPIPGWIRLDRNGDTFTGYWAVDNNGTPGPWQMGETHTLTGMGSNVYVGIGLTSHSNGVTGTAHLDHVSITGFTPQTPPAAAVLTPAAFNQAGSLLSRTKVDVTNFSTTFNFVMQAVGNNPIADGMTFTLENEPPGTNYSESVLKLSPAGAGQNMTVTDYFTPHDWKTLDNNDADLGSGGTLLLPDAVGSAAHPHLLIETGKTGRIYLMDRDSFGGFNSRIDPVLQTVQIGGPGVWGNAAFLQDGPNTGLIFYWGQSAPGQAFRITNGVIDPNPVSKTTFNMAFPGSQPSISSNGMNGSSAIMWAIRSDNYGSAGPESLYAFNAENLQQQLWSSNDVPSRDAIGGTSVKFTFPIVANGHVYAGSNGSLAVYGLLPSHTTAPAAPSTLVATPLASTQIRLTWTNPSSNNATLIKIERSTAGAGGPFTQIAQVNPQLTTFTDTGLTPLTHYWYRIRATNQAGDSGNSNTADALTPIPASVLNVAGVTSTEVDLSWTRTGNDHYDVLRSTDGGAFVVIASNLPVTQTTYADKTVVRPHTYQYQIHAFNVNPASESFSNAGSAVVGPVDIEFPFPNGIGNTNGLQFNGSALYSGTERLIRLNNDATQAGSVFTTDKVSASKWSTTFWVRLHEGTQPNPADGFTFTLQANSPSALGGTGTSLGYQGIGKSITIKFDVFNNSGETDNSTGLFFNGDAPDLPLQSGEVNVPLDKDVVNLRDQDRKRIDLSYDVVTKTLTETITDETQGGNHHVTITYNVDVPAVIGTDAVYAGLTGGTGSNFTLQDVLGWVFPQTAPAEPANVQVVTGTNTATLTWTSNSTNEDGFQIERSADNYHFTPVGRVGVGVTTFQDTGIAPGIYFYRVRAVNALGSSAPSTSAPITIGGTVVPIDHALGFDTTTDLQANGTAKYVGSSLGAFIGHLDIGTPGNPAIAGNATFANGTYTLTASGTDIWGTADHFQFLYEPITGDGQIIARLVSEQSGVNDLAKSGVMIRESLAAGAKDAFMLQFPNPGSRAGWPTYQWRGTTGGNTADHQFQTREGPPAWLRLVRSGDVLTGYWAVDMNGTPGPWNQLGAETVVMGPTVYIGLAVTAHTNSGTVASSFDHVSISQGTPLTQAVAARLTDAVTSQAGSIWRKQPVPVTGSFHTSFLLNIRGSAPGNIADGMTFTIQNDPNGPAALGGSGGSLGYSGIQKSVAVMFDIYSSGSHLTTTKLLLNGSTDRTGAINMGPAIDATLGHPIQVDLSYDGYVLFETLTDLVTQQSFHTDYSVDIRGIVGSDTAYVGFTGATGGEAAVQDIVNWTATFNPFKVSPHLAVADFPGIATAGEIHTFTVAPQSYDGRTITSYRGTVHFTSTDPQALLSGDYTFTGADQGRHTFAAVLRTAGTQSLLATDAGTGTISGFEDVTVLPAAAATFALSSGSTVAGQPFNFTVTAKDPYGNTVTGYTGIVHFMTSDPQAVLPADYTFTAADRGSHTFTIVLATAGNQTVTVTDQAGHTATATITVTPGATAGFYVAGPGEVTAGDQFIVQVYAVDAFGNLTPNYSGTITFSSADPLAGLPGDYTFSPANQGQANFIVSLYTAGLQDVTVADTANGDMAGSAYVQVDAAQAVALVVGGFPSPTTAGTEGSFTVMAVDQYGNVATSYTGTVAFFSSDPQAMLPDTYTFSAADQGMATFAATLFTAGSQVLGAYDVNDPTIAGGEQDGIVVVPDAAHAAFVVSGFPSPTTAGTPGTFTVTVVDPYGNVVTDFTDQVAFYSSDPNGDFMPRVYRFTLADMGTATFTATLNTPGMQLIGVIDVDHPSVVGEQDDIEVDAPPSVADGAGTQALAQSLVVDHGSATLPEASGSVAVAATSEQHSPAVLTSTASAIPADEVHDGLAARLQAVDLVLAGWDGDPLQEELL